MILWLLLSSLTGTAFYMLTSELQPFLNQPAPCSCLRGFPHCCSDHQAQCWLFAAPCDPLEWSALCSTHARSFRVNSTAPSACGSSLPCGDCWNTLFCKQNTTELIRVFLKLHKPAWIIGFVFVLCNSIKRGNRCRLGKLWASIMSLYMPALGPSVSLQIVKNAGANGCTVDVWHPAKWQSQQKIIYWTTAFEFPGDGDAEVLAVRYGVYQGFPTTASKHTYS